MADEQGVEEQESEEGTDEQRSEEQSDASAQDDDKQASGSDDEHASGEDDSGDSGDSDGDNGGPDVEIEDEATTEEEAQSKMRKLEEAGPPDELGDWPTDQSMYLTFGGAEGEASYEDSAVRQVGPSSVRHYEDGSVEVQGEMVDNPDDYKRDKSVFEESEELGVDKGAKSDDEEESSSEDGDSTEASGEDSESTEASSEDSSSSEEASGEGSSSSEASDEQSDSSEASAEAKSDDG